MEEVEALRLQVATLQSDNRILKEALDAANRVISSHRSSDSEFVVDQPDSEMRFG